MTINKKLTEEEVAFVQSRLLHHQENMDKAIKWEDLKTQLEQTL